VTRWALRAALPLALLLTTAPGASAATCTATASGAWTTAAIWSCSGGPGPSDAVVIPAGKTVSVTEDSNEAGPLTLRGTLALGDLSELDVSDLAAGGGTISGPQNAMLVVTVATGRQATVDGAGLSVTGAYLIVTGDGTFAIAGPLALTGGGWVESDIDATWTGSAPWQIGGAAGAPTSGFEVSGAQLTINGETSAQATGAGESAIQLDGTTLVKQDAATSDLDVEVLIDSAAIHVAAGKLIGRFQGAGSLSVDAGATLGLAGAGLQIAPPTIDLAGGTLEAEPASDVSLVLPGAPALHALTIGAKAALDVSISGGQSGPVAESSSPPDALADEVAIAAGATLSIDGGGGALALPDSSILSGSGTLDASLENVAGTVSPNGALHVTGAYSQGEGGTLALDLRGAGDGDSLRVEGTASLAGTLKVTTAYAPAATATPLVLAAAAKPAGSFAKTAAPLPSGRAWSAAYTAAGVELELAHGGGKGALAALVRPSLQPAIPVVGGRTHCSPGRWKGTPALTYQWLRGGKPIAGATSARYRVAAGDGGRSLACRVTATAAGGLRGVATSRSARARVGLRIGAVTVQTGGKLSVVLRCAASERRCSGSLRVLVSGRAVARGHFALSSPGGLVQVPRVGGTARLAGDSAIVRAGYRNQSGAGRAVKRRLLVG
jgi:hypothetical protein